MVRDLKKIQIFLVTRNENENEYLEISDFIGEINRHLEMEYSMSVDLLTVDSIDASKWQLEEYMDKICESEMVYFLIFIKMEEFLIEDFGAAFEKLKKDDKQDIYIYFYEADNSDRETNVQQFMKRLDNEIGHYFGIYNNIDTIKLKILMSLKLKELNMVEITFRNGNLVVEEKNVMSIQNVKMFENNDQLNMWKEQLQKAEEEYFALKALCIQYDKDEEIRKKYLQAETKRTDIKESIEETEKILFEQSLNLVKDMDYGEITTRQREAYNLFENGDIEAAIKILDVNDMKRDYKSVKKKMEERRREEDKRLATIHIREFKTRIEILEVMTSYKERFAEITNAYEEIMAIAFEENVEYDMVCNYVKFLYDQNRNKKAFEIGKTLEIIYAVDENIELYNKARLYNLMGLITNRTNDMRSEAEKYFKRAIEIREYLVKENIERYAGDLAGSYNNVGIFYKAQGDMTKADEYYKKAIETREELVRKCGERYEPYLALSYFNYGILKKDNNYFEKALNIANENTWHPYCRHIVKILSQYFFNLNPSSSDKKE